MNQRVFQYRVLLLLFVLTCSLAAGTSGQGNSGTLSVDEIQGMYEMIRVISFDSTKILHIDTCVLQRDVGRFVFESGSLYFLESVCNRVIAAYFKGKGIFQLTTDNAIERQQVQRFTDEDNIEQKFERAFFVFTDSTYEHFTAQQATMTQAFDHKIAKEIEEFRKKIREYFFSNTDVRILCDLATSQYGHMFQVYFECPKSIEFCFSVDPLQNEEVDLIRYKRAKHKKWAEFETWYSARAQDTCMRYDYAFDIRHIDIDVSIGSRQILSATTNLNFTSLVDGAQVVPMRLAPELRVTAAVSGADSCFFIQEAKEQDAMLWVIFPAPLKRDTLYELTLVYSGKDIVQDVGGKNFVVNRRTSWYPSFDANWPDPARFTMKFAVPEKMTLLSTGKLLRTWKQDKIAYSEWDSEIEYTVVGFNYGKFSNVREKSSLCEVDCYTNNYLSDDLHEIRRILEQNRALQAELMMLPQELTTDKLGKRAAIESRNAYEVYVHFFGEIPFQKITVSQQPQASFAQSWPRLIYLPFTAFLRESVLERLFGLRLYTKYELFYETIAPHEIAHQWWGHTVIINSYHDEWLNEGFATYSTALYFQIAEDTKSFKKYMNVLREAILKKVEKGKRATELGPIWIGRRLNSLDTPTGYMLIYSKGAYILHMLRMMLFDYKTKSDERFIAMMKNYVSIYSGKIASTVDFKSVVEKHFSDDMTWFFNQWVYGTAIPVYTFDYYVDATDDGKYLLTITAQQKEVSPDFKMPFHFVVNFKNEHAVVHMLITGSEPIKKQFKLPSKPNSIEANPWNGVLCKIEE
jgi:hypothetical protein